MVITLSWIAMIFSIIGAYNVTKSKPKNMVVAMICYIISSTLVFIYAILIMLIPLAISNLVFIILECYGLYTWSQVYRKILKEESKSEQKITDNVT